MSEAVKLTHNEDIKAAIPTVAGTIAATIADAGADHFSQDDYEFLKFHGVYQQDDRDLRKTAKKYIMMARASIPGGVMTAAQWMAFDDLAAQYGNQTLRITTRQGIQFHGVLKPNVRSLIQGINHSLLTTISACGDVRRNVMAPPTPAYTLARAQVLEDCRRVAQATRPQTRAYHAIWIEGVQLNLDDPENKNFSDPLYGKAYLPRKFKIAFAIPPVNDIDIFTNCIGFIAIAEDERLAGYNVAAGGGLGRSHGNIQTYPRLADVVGFLPPEKVVDVARAALTIHRDYGDRADRKHARFKYIVAERGPEWVRAEIEKRAGIRLEPAR
ncbi:MAG: sulfite reductase, partial [Verrucomicrobia bacterium]|nr:sulfite reductase [Verrucomicrobiota bacterium]